MFEVRWGRALASAAVLLVGLSVIVVANGARFDWPVLLVALAVVATPVTRWVLAPRARELGARLRERRRG